MTNKKQRRRDAQAAPTTPQPKQPKAEPQKAAKRTPKHAARKADGDE